MSGTLRPLSNLTLALVTTAGLYVQGRQPPFDEERERREPTWGDIEQAQFAPADAKRLAERALSEAAVGRIRPIIGQTFPLEQAADARTPRSRAAASSERPCW